MFKLTWIRGVLLGACAIGVLAGLLTSNTAALVWCLASTVWTITVFQLEDYAEELMQHLEHAWAENDRLRQASNTGTSEDTDYGME